MNLREDIKKATSLPLLDDDPKFFRLRELSQAAKDRKMNERKLLEDDSTDSDIDERVKPIFDQYAITAAIKEVNGGLDLSNKHWERYWSEHLKAMTNSEKEKSQASSTRTDIKTHSESLPEKKLSKESIKPKPKIFKNAAIMGLVNTKKILLEDLIASNNENFARIENKLEVLNGNTSNDTADGKSQVNLVPLREDPEIFVHPLRLGIDVKQFKDIDFTVARIGKKKKETPQQYFLRTTNDDFFNFVKKTKST